MGYNEGDIQVWYMPLTTGGVYTVDVPSRDLREALRILDAITGLSNFEFRQGIKPDYSDAGGISRYEVNGDGGFDWYVIDGYELIGFDN